MTTFRKIYGLDKCKTWKELNDKVETFIQQGNYFATIIAANEALKVAEDKFGSNHSSVTTSLDNLAKAYVNQRQYAKAKALYKRSLKIRKKVLGKNHTDVSQSLNDLAGLLGDQGKYAKAEQLYKRALEINEKAQGVDNPSVAIILNNLAHLYIDQGKYTEAGSLYKRALEICEKALSPDHPIVARIRGNLALQGRYNKMITKDLSFNELHELIGIFLKLTNINEVLSVFSKFYNQEIINIDDLYKQFSSPTSVKLVYKGFDIRITDIRPSKSGFTSLCAEFKKKESIWYKIFKKTTREVVGDLKSICQDSISDLNFSKFSFTPPNENYTLKYYYDENAFNHNFQDGREISSLIIAPDAHDGNCFIEFLFNPDCYMQAKKEHKIEIRPTWKSHVSNIKKGIEESARKIPLEQTYELLGLKEKYNKEKEG